MAKNEFQNQEKTQEKTTILKKETRPSIKRSEYAFDLVEIKKSNIAQAGFGAFAKSHIPANHTLGEYKGNPLFVCVWGKIRTEHQCYFFHFGIFQITGVFSIF